MEAQGSTICNDQEENDSIEKYIEYEIEDNIQDAFTKEEQIESLEQFSNWSQICRVCAHSNDHIIPIFEGEGAEHELSKKIHQYLPIKVYETDTLPIQLCYHCAATILAWHELLEGCLDAEKQLLRMQDAQNYKDENLETKSSETFSSANKETVDDPMPTVMKKQEPNTLRQQEEETNEDCTLANEITNRSLEHMYEFVKNVPEDNMLVYEDEVKNVFCERCNFGYFHMSDLVEHMRSIHDDDVHHCHHCELIYRGSDEIFQQHMRNHESETEIGDHSGDGTSSVRKMGFEEYSSVNIDNNESKPIIFGEDALEPQEVMRLIDRSDSTGDISEFKCRAEETIKEARNITDVSSYMCEFCGKSYPSLTNLRAHQQIIHGHLELHMCDLCERNYTTASALANHRRSHTRAQNPYTCEYCEKRFRTANSMHLHRRIHENRKPHVCTKCEKRFTRKESLREHLADHEKNLTFVCETCGKSFARKRNLLRHFHVHSNDETFVCKFCPSTKFRQKRYLKVHTQIHHPDELDNTIKSTSK